MSFKINTKESSKNKKEVRGQAKIYQLTAIGVMTAITCILGPLSIPIGPVPLSLTNLVICMTAVILGWKMATISCSIYLLIGMVGVPVFSGFSAGVGKLFGPTGGYLIGFIFLAIIGGLFVDHFQGKKYMYLIGMLFGSFVVDMLGSLWLSYQTGMSFYKALMIGCVPFILGDTVKICIAIIIGEQIKKRIGKINIL